MRRVGIVCRGPSEAAQSYRTQSSFCARVWIGNCPVLRQMDGLLLEVARAYRWDVIGILASPRIKILTLASVRVLMCQEWLI